MPLANCQVWAGERVPGRQGRIQLAVDPDLPDSRR